LDISRISLGEMIAGVGGLLLFLFMFLNWYGAEPDGVEPVAGNAWELFSLIDLLLFLAALLAVAVAVARAAGKLPELPIPPDQIVAIAGAVAVVLVLFRLIFTPGDGEEVAGVELEVTRKLGVFLGLLASAAIAFGGYAAMNERASGEAPPG